MASDRRRVRRGTSGGGVRRKMLQLCAQIRRTLDLTLMGDTDDEVLQNMSVQSVEPAPGNRVQVVFTVHPPGTELAKEEVLAKLEEHRPLFLREIAHAVSRRSVPELSFWVVKEGDAPPKPGDDDPAVDDPDGHDTASDAADEDD